MEKRLSTIFGRPPIAASGEKKEAMAVAEWSPLVDISEDDKGYVVKAELPEMKKEEIKINVLDDVLSISGERKYEKEEKGKKYHRVERAYGSFMRSFTLPEGQRRVQGWRTKRTSPEVGEGQAEIDRGEGVVRKRRTPCSGIKNILRSPGMSIGNRGRPGVTATSGG
jgi:HSP20 family molecular chaperone IbpA